ncbi:MAG: GYF domain-containing protein [Kiritimatiellia bacterium]
MSRIHQRLQSLRREASDSWFLKVTTGQKYGPVSIATLREWAAEGRIAADSLVSHDGRSWLPAESLPELEMDWIVTLPDGTSYGPFNLRATRHLVNIGIIDQEAVVRNHHTGVELAVKAVLEAKDLSLLIREARERPPVIEVSEVAELRTVSPDLSRTVKELSGEAQAKVAELDTVRRHLEEEKVRRAEVEARCTELEKKIREQLQELEQVAGAKDQETEAVRAELAALKEGQAEAEQRMAAREQELQNRIRELEEEMASGTELLAQAQEQLRSQQATWREEKARAAEQIRELKEKLEKVEEEAGTSRVTAEKLRRELEALQAVASENTELAATREKELEERLANLAAELQSARQERDYLRREVALRAEKLTLAEKAAKDSE